MATKQKLELTWIGKESRPKLEPRILIEDPERSYHAPHRVSKNDIFDNILIHGDNLLALKALEQEFTGQVKCIYIDPPYNTGSAFQEYDDGLEHSLWLSMVQQRVELLWRFLKDDGSIWTSLDDNEAHYYRILSGEIFGRDCFITDIAWRKRDGAPNDRKIGSVHEHIIVCGKRRSKTSKKTDAEEAFNLEVGPDRSLLICCTAFRCDPNQFPNLTLKKIPNAVLTHCEWGKDDYSLAVANLPAKPLEPGTQTSLFEEV